MAVLLPHLAPVAVSCTPQRASNFFYSSIRSLLLGVPPFQGWPWFVGHMLAAAPPVSGTIEDSADSLSWLSI